MGEPLTSPDCDLRGLPFMPLDVVRLTDSDLFALSTGDEFKAALTLWCKAWLQVPAASLPNDDRILAHLSGAGSKWRKVREIALRGFELCGDGRLYHRVIAEKANDAWDRRGEWQEKQNNKNERQQRWRERVMALCAELRALGVTPPAGAAVSTLERLLVDAKASTGDAVVDTMSIALTGTGTGTGTVVPFSSENGSIDLGKTLFDQGVELLVSKGRKEPTARAIIAELQRDYGDPAVLDAINRCRNATEPVGAMKQILGKAKRQAEYFGV